MVNINRLSTVSAATTPAVPSLSSSLDPVQKLLLDIQAGRVTGNSIRDAVSVAMREIGKPCPLTMEVNPGKGLQPLPYFLSPQERIDTLTTRSWPMTLRDVFNMTRFTEAGEPEVLNCRVKCNGREIRGEEIWGILVGRENDITLPQGSVTMAQVQAQVQRQQTPTSTPPVTVRAKGFVRPGGTRPDVTPQTMLERVKDTLLKQGGIQFPSEVSDNATIEYLIDGLDSGELTGTEDGRSFSVVGWKPIPVSLSLQDRLRQGNTPPVAQVAPTAKGEGLQGYEWDAAKSRYRPLRSEGEANAAYMQRCRLSYEAQRNGTFDIARGAVPMISLVQEPVSMVAIAERALTEGRTASTNTVSRVVKEELDTTKMAKAIAHAMGEGILSEERVREIVREEMYINAQYILSVFQSALSALPSHRKP